MEDLKWGLALAGGGAKGAYQAGVYKALYDAGYKFDYVVGTSIGAVNGVMIVQEKIGEMINLWENAVYSQLVDVDDKEFDRFIHEDITKDNILYKLGYALDIVKNNGLDISPMEEMLHRMVDEKRVRESKIKFGLNFIDLGDFSNYDVFIDQIPEGKLIDAITYSAMLPFFDQSYQEEKYLDGGFYRNIPHRMIEDKCDKVIIVVLQRFRITPSMRKDPKLDIIEPSEKLPLIMEFNPESSKKSLKIGYYDGKRYTDNLMGEHFYIEPISTINTTKIIENLNQSLNYEEAGLKKLPLDLNNIYSSLFYSENQIGFIVDNLEYIGKKYEVDRFKICSARELAEEILRTGKNFRYWEKIFLKSVTKTS